MAEEFAERTEQPTPKRLVEAREDGNVFQSRDLAAALFLAAVTLILWIAAVPGLEKCASLLRAWLESSAIAHGSTASMAESTNEFAMAIIRIVLPILLFIWLAGYLATVVQIGWLFTPKPIQPNATRINPVKGLHRIFGVSGLVKGILDLLKVLFVGVVVAMTIIQHSERIVTLAQLKITAATGAIGWLLLDLAWRVCAVLLVLGILDLLYRKWKHAHDLRMTRQQIKDELKQTEGDPEIRRRRGRSRHSSAQRLTIHRT